MEARTRTSPIAAAPKTNDGADMLCLLGNRRKRVVPLGWTARRPAHFRESAPRLPVCSSWIHSFLFKPWGVLDPFYKIGSTEDQAGTAQGFHQSLGRTTS